MKSTPSPVAGFGAGVPTVAARADAGVGVGSAFASEIAPWQPASNVTIARLRMLKGILEDILEDNARRIRTVPLSHVRDSAFVHLVEHCRVLLLDHLALDLEARR